MRTWSGRSATVAAALVWAVPAIAAQPPAQPSSKYAVIHPSRPTPHKSVVDRGMSLEQECLNALRATRAAASSPGPGDEAKRDTAALHLDRAETAARAGRGQLCQDELALATENLR
ncbi:MAG: hypothetical protein JO128_12150 [Alphaproteobacteria bacterium]|nr:hypothetical protein [Alphaproteobacteria bacterium]